ncbi:PREDICTED: uncharacterized protein LOC101308896 [Fragaria vesca subsp. vesca]
METNKPKASVSFFLVMMLLSISSCSAFNITKLLEKEDDFSTFNQHLSDTKLADQINKRSTITVLAVDNSAIGGLGDDSVVKAIMSVHVILDYYDKEKLTKLAKNNKSATLTTLYQTSGLAKNEQGFVRIATDDDGITFGSASKGSQMNSKLVKSVTSQPYNISVLQVSSIIEVPNINADPSPEKAPAPKSRKAKPPSPASSDDSADSPSDDTADSPTDDPDMDDNAPSPAKHHTPPKPKDVDSDSPSSSPAPGPAAGDGAGKSDARANAAEMGVGVVALGYFDGYYPCPPRFVVSEEGSVTREISDAYKEWKMVDKALIGLLMASLDDDVMDIIGADSIEKYILRIKHAKDQLSSVGVTMVDEDIIVVTLNGLPEEYSMIKTVIRARDDSISFKDLRAQLLAAERDIEAQFSLSGTMTTMAARGSSSFKGSSRNGANNFSGDKGKRQGHIARICFNNPASPNYGPGNGDYRNSSGASLECQLCISPNEVWIGDTGATHQMTSDLRNLAIAHPYDSTNSITIGNGEGLSIKHIGSTEITPSSHTFQLNKFFIFQDKVSRAILHQGRSTSEGLFLFTTPQIRPSHTAFIGSAVKSILWYQRLGHPSVPSLVSPSQVDRGGDGVVGDVGASVSTGSSVESGSGDNDISGADVSGNENSCANVGSNENDNNEDSSSADQGEVETMNINMNGSTDVTSLFNGVDTNSEILPYELSFVNDPAQ